MVEEMKKSTPRDAILLPVMKSTFQDRRIFIQNDAKSVRESLEVYPALNRPAVVSLTLYSGHFVDEKRAWAQFSVHVLSKLGITLLVYVQMALFLN